MTAVSFSYDLRVHGCLSGSGNFTPASLFVYSLKLANMEVNLRSQAPPVRKVKGYVAIDAARCKGCELCAVACKEDVLLLGPQLNKKGYRYVVAKAEVCTGCTNCALVCPDAVITVYRTPAASKR